MMHCIAYKKCTFKHPISEGSGAADLTGCLILVFLSLFLNAIMKELSNKSIFAKVICKN